MNMKMNNFSFDYVYQIYSSTASFEGFVESSADPTTLAEVMLYTSYTLNSENFEEHIIKGHGLDFTLEKIMKKYDPAMRTLAEL